MHPFTPQQRCLLRLSVNTWHQRGAAKCSGLSFSEETATETLLLDLAARFPGKVTIVPFTHPVEAETGADWAWGFIGPDGHSCQGMLVQAKRLDDGDREYKELFRQARLRGGGPSILQLNRLIATAKRFKLPPVYAFYNHLDDPGRVPRGSCPTLALLGQPWPESWGVAIASAIEVRNAKPNKTYDRHRYHSRPLHCLLCSRGTGRQDAMGSAGAAASGLSALFEGAGRGDLGPGLVPPFVPSRGLPKLFEEAERIHQARSSRPQASIDFGSEFPGIAGAVIVRDT